MEDNTGFAVLPNAKKLEERLRKECSRTCKKYGGLRWDYSKERLGESEKCIIVYANEGTLQSPNYQPSPQPSTTDEHRDSVPKLRNYTSNVYSDTGLVPTNFILKSPVSGTVVDLSLYPSVPELQESPMTEEKTDEVTYVVMKHHIAMEGYQDLAATLPTLPRSHKVLIAALK